MHAGVGELGDDTVPYLAERRGGLARPRQVERRVQAWSPIRDRSVEVARGNPERAQLPLVPAPVDASADTFDSLVGDDAAWSAMPAPSSRVAWASPPVTLRTSREV
jgi:hypothetical protein